MVTPNPKPRNPRHRSCLPPQSATIVRAPCATFIESHKGSQQISQLAPKSSERGQSAAAAVGAASGAGDTAGALCSRGSTFLFSFYLYALGILFRVHDSTFAFGIYHVHVLCCTAHGTTSHCTTCPSSYGARLPPSLPT